ncbi:YgcG family protein [Alloprevotella sp. Lung230]|uniref:TPM domain-containing protein n=1 Tax=Alloprevotella sp. Lung230 TaxID=2766595 RepID=UPI001654DC9B|nr:TPM domain-containing protein [Alloprevotella sp. Lung230]MBC8625656.1 TPM domain-containing protein [Alloprevotella sp. Lung230]
MLLLRPQFSLRPWLMLLLLSLTAVIDTMARTWRPEEVPIPYLQDARRYVSNPEGILSAAAVDSIDRILFALERDKGVQTVVMVLDRLEGDDPYDFAMRVARKYGVGSKQKRTGLVIVLATGDRSYQFLTGNGLEGTLPDGAIQRIEDRIFVPRLKRQDWDGAMVSAVAAIDGICRGDESLSRGEIEGQEDGWGGWMFLLIAVISIGGTALYTHYVKLRPRLCPACGRKELRFQQRRTRHERRDGHRYLVVETTYRCRQCGHVKVEREAHRDDPPDVGTGLLLGSLLAGAARGRSGLGGSGFSGGSFGGGSFGGGGSGGRF